MSDLVNACVLLSGGMDSTAALHWARERTRSVRAIGFQYGQPNRDNELTAARKMCERLAVPYTGLALADTLLTGTGLLGATDLAHDPAAMGVSRAFVPGRNAVFLTVAAAHAATWWKTGRVDLVVGACADDREGFPDCRANFFDAIERAICRGYGRDVRVHAPFVSMRKAEILTAASPEAREDIARSWSCYRREGPCGACTPCVLRAEAFAAAGVTDQSAPAVMFGGDPERMWR